MTVHAITRLRNTTNVALIIVGAVASVLGLAAIAVPGLRSPLIGLAVFLSAFTIYMTVAVSILVIWGARGFVALRGRSPVGRAMGQYARSRTFRVKIAMVAVVLLGVAFMGLDVWLRRTTGQGTSSWGGLALAIWCSLAGVVFSSACIRKV